MILSTAPLRLLQCNIFLQTLWMGRCNLIIKDKWCSCCAFVSILLPRVSIWERPKHNHYVRNLHAGEPFSFHWLVSCNQPNYKRCLNPNERRCCKLRLKNLPSSSIIGWYGVFGSVIFCLIGLFLSISPKFTSSQLTRPFFLIWTNTSSKRYILRLKQEQMPSCTWMSLFQDYEWTNCDNTGVRLKAWSF